MLDAKLVQLAVEQLSCITMLLTIFVRYADSAFHVLFALMSRTTNVSTEIVNTLLQTRCRSVRENEGAATVFLYLVYNG